ncbi:MAG: hypothetical protein WAR37_04990 [Candidatus Microsaccharimonas sp.]
MIERISTLRQSVTLGKETPIENGPTCHGAAFEILNADGSVDTTRDFARLVITRRYPENGLLFSQNDGSEEEVEITSGRGYLLRLKASGFMSRIALKPGNKLKIPQGDLFAWVSQSTDTPDEALTFDMICRPGFDPEKYHYVEHKIKKQQANNVTEDE